MTTDDFVPRKRLEDMSREERVKAGQEEIWWMVQGGQDGEEYTNSVLFLIKVLESLK